MAQALGNIVYIWDVTNISVEELMQVSDEGQITSMAWGPNGHHQFLLA